MKTYKNKGLSLKGKSVIRFRKGNDQLPTDTDPTITVTTATSTYPAALKRV